MALSTVDEIDKTTDPSQIKKLASYVVILLNPIIEQATADGKKDNAFDYRLIQADMMVRAGQNKAAAELSVALQEEKKDDIRSYMAEARGRFSPRACRRRRTPPCSSPNRRIISRGFSRG